MLARFVVFCLFALSTDFALAQSGFDKFMEQDKKASSETEKFRAVLNGDDSDRALRAMQFMLQSGDLILVKAAQEFGLFSTNRSVQHEALKAIFNSGGPFRLVVDLSSIDDKKMRMSRYINERGGAIAADHMSGSIVFSVDSADNCWVFRGSENCALILQGTNVSLAPWYRGTGSLTLNDAGILVGSIGSAYSNPSYSPVPAQIDLLQ